jgi:hypothetical protein
MDGTTESSSRFQADLNVVQSPRHEAYSFNDNCGIRNRFVILQGKALNAFRHETQGGGYPASANGAAPGAFRASGRAGQKANVWPAHASSRQSQSAATPDTSMVSRSRFDRHQLPAIRQVFPPFNQRRSDFRGDALGSRGLSLGRWSYCSAIRGQDRDAGSGPLDR